MSTPDPGRRAWPGAHEIHAWTAAPDEVGSAWTTLSCDERERAARLRHAGDRLAFAAGRGWLRAVLAGYLGCGPGAVRFGLGPHGKPHLPDAPDLRFSFARSGGLAVLAVATGREVGIDLEAIQPMREPIAERLFAPAEAAALARLSGAARLAGIYAAWTRKEAYLKALGSGLAAPLDGFAVSVSPGEPAQLLAVAADPDEAARWQMAELDVGPGYAGAVAARWTGWSVVPGSGTG